MSEWTITVKEREPTGFREVERTYTPAELRELFAGGGDVVTPLLDRITALEADLKALRAACEKLGAEVARVHGIAQTHLHPDRSISLEAQGYDQIDCAVIGAVDSMAAKILNSNPPLGIESPIKTLLADPIAAKYIKEAT